MHLGHASARPIAEAMEERILHSADFSPLSNAAAGVFDVRMVSAPATDAAVQRNEIVFIDAAVPDAAALVADLQAQRAAGRRVEIVAIAAGQDGIDVIGKALANRHDLAAVHVLAHGADGQVQLGNATLDEAALMQRAGQVAAWATALAPDADLLLYGCDVAQTAHGERFVRDLAALTGADVAASDDLTGAASRGGDWALEYRVGQIAAPTALSALEQARWQGVLATFTVTTTADQVGAAKLDGSLRWAVEMANTTAGRDEIRFAVDGTFRIAAGPSGEDANNYGDFDVYGDVDIIGNGASKTVIDGNGVDRVFNTHGGTISISALTVQNGVSTDSGGGIYNDLFSYLTLDQVKVAGNTASFDGGGIYNRNATLVVKDSWIDNNSAGLYGGGVASKNGQAAVLIENSTISAGNAAYGAGISAANGRFWLQNSTVSGNSATAWGGGIYVGGASLTVESATIAYNVALVGGGIYNAGSASFHNSLITSSTGGDSVGALFSAGYNMANDVGVFNAPTDTRKQPAVIKLNPVLAPNGFLAPTHALPANSAAVNAGDPSITAADQRHAARPDRADIGAYEFGGELNQAPVVNAPASLAALEDTNTNVSGVSVSDASLLAGNDLASVTLSVGNGRISVGGPATIAAGASGSNTFTLTGTEANINASLASLRYGGNSNYNGVDTLVIAARDNAGATTTRNVAITVAAVNDPPQGTSTTIVMLENTSHSFTRSDFGFVGSPGESDAFASVILSAPANGVLSVGGSAVATSVEVTVAQLDTGSVVFTPVGNASGSPYTTLAFRVRDNGGTANGGVDLDPALRTFTINVNIASAAPVISSDGGGDDATRSVIENTTAVTTVVASSAAPGAMTYAIAGGADAASFTLDAGTGVLRFVAAPNFEVPADTDADNRYEVTVRATDSVGGIDLQRLTITLTNANEAPALVNALPDRSVTQGTPVSFLVDAGNFADPDAGDTLRYAATLVGGAALPTWLVLDTATGRFSGTPADADVGTVNVRVTALDIAGASATSDFALTVANVNDAPVAAAPIASQSATQDAAFSFTVPASAFDDADFDSGDTLRYAARLVGGAPLPAWLTLNSATGEFTGTPADADVGSLNIRVTAIDQSGARANSDFTLDVANVNDAPVVTGFIPWRVATQGNAFTFTVPANAFDDADLDNGDALHFDATLVGGAPLPAWLRFDSATGQFTGTPANGDVGVLGIRVAAIDNAGATAASGTWLFVIDVNEAPTAAAPIADQAATQDAAWRFTVPAAAFDDIDAGDVLRYRATLVDGSALPSWLALNGATGEFRGTPADADVGTLAIRVIAIDLAGATATSDFSLAVQNVNDAPRAATPMATQAAMQGSAFDFQVPLAAFTDADLDSGDALRYLATQLGGATLPAWLVFDTATGRFSGVPADADVGAVAVRLTAIDLAGATASSDFRIVVANRNDAPVAAAPIANQSTSQGAGFSFTVPADAFTDVDLPKGDALSFTASQSNGAALPAWLRFDGSALQFVGTPTDVDVGTWQIRVTATDLAGATAFSDFTTVVTNLNDSPAQAMTIADQVATQGSAFTFSVPASAFADVDADSGDRLQYRATLANGGALPAWLAFDDATGGFRGTPADADVGTLVVRVSATDSAGVSAQSAFRLVVANANDAPVLARSPQDQSFTQGAVFGFAVPSDAFTDLDSNKGDRLSYSATLADGSALPAWLSVDAATGRFIGAPGPNDAGVFSVRIVATDAAGAAAHGDFALNVMQQLALPSHRFDAPMARAAEPTAPDAAPAVSRAVAEAVAPSLPPAEKAIGPRVVFDLPSADSPAEGVKGDLIEVRTEIARSNRFSFQSAVPALPASEGSESVAAPRLLGNEDMKRRMDELRRQAKSGIDAGHKVAAGSTLAVGGGLSVGYVVWLVRGGVLASSMLSALPAWQMIDPLPVVTAGRGKKGAHDAEAGDDNDVERLFKKSSHAERPAAAKVAAARVPPTGHASLGQVPHASSAKP